MNQSNDYTARLNAALTELDSKGVSNRVSRPPYFRIARHYNLQVKPPYYASVAFNATFSCVVFSALWCLTMWFFVWHKTDMGFKELLVQSVNGGLIVGLITALFCYAASRYYKLTAWDNLLEQDQPPSNHAD